MQDSNAPATQPHSDYPKLPKLPGLALAFSPVACAWGFVTCGTEAMQDPNAPATEAPKTPNPGLAQGRAGGELPCKHFSRQQW